MYQTIFRQFLEFFYIFFKLIRTHQRLLREIYHFWQKKSSTSSQSHFGWWEVLTMKREKIKQSEQSSCNSKLAMHFKCNESLFNRTGYQIVFWQLRSKIDVNYSNRWGNSIPPKKLKVSEGTTISLLYDDRTSYLIYKEHNKQTSQFQERRKMVVRYWVGGLISMTLT